MKIPLLVCFSGCIGCLTGCVTSSPDMSPPAMSMSAGQFYARFPVATQSYYLTGVDADTAVMNGDCVRLNWRSYDAPVGASVEEDLRNGAEGVDAIVANDGGNAYRISDFDWRPVRYGTQLNIVFYTFLCNFAQ